LVDLEDTLGVAGVAGDSLAGLSLRIEKDGLYVDPKDIFESADTVRSTVLTDVALRKESESHGQ
jgi:hypothetical protein